LHEFYVQYYVLTIHKASMWLQGSCCSWRGYFSIAIYLVLDTNPVENNGRSNNQNKKHTEPPVASFRERRLY